MERKEVSQLAGGTGIALLGGVAGNGLGYLTGILLSRFVGAEIIGVYFLCLVWTQLASALARMGMADSLLRFVPPARLENDEVRAWRTVRSTLMLGIGASLGITVVTAFALPGLGRALGVDAILVHYLQRFLWTIPLHVVFVLSLMAVQSYQRIPPVVFARDFLQPTLLCLGTVALVLVAEPDLALVVGYAGSLVCGIVVIGVSLVRTARHAPGVRGLVPLAPLLAFAAPVMLGDVVHYLYRWVDTIVISYFLELRDVGIYNAALRTSLLIALIFMATNVIYSTMAAGFLNTGQHEKARSALKLSMRWCFLLALPLVVLFISAGEPILSLWGSEFADGATALAILAVAQLLTIPIGIFAYTLIMSGRQVLELGDTLLGLALILGLDVLLIPRFGLEGGAAALLLANAAGVAIRWVQVYGLLGVHPFDWKIAKPAAAAGVAGGLSLAVQPWLGGWLAGGGTFGTLGGLVLLTLLVGITFFGFHLWLGFEEDDRMVFRMLVSKLGGAAPPEHGS